MIDFSPPDHVAATVSDIHRFIEREIAPIERDLFEHLVNEHLYLRLRADGRLAPEVEDAQRTIRKRSAERGFYALHMPTEVGGGGFCLTDMFFVHEAVYRHGIGVAQWLLSWTEGPNRMLMFLTPEQQRKYLLPLVRGDATAAYAITEYRGGSDVLGMETRAEKHGDAWVVNGTKAYITNAQYADLIFVCALHDPGAGGAGAIAFVVERDNPGLGIGRTYRTIMDDGMTGELRFENCRLSADHLWGAPGDGFYLSIGMINWIRVRRGGMCTGLGHYLLDRCLAHLKNRQAFGGPLSRFKRCSGWPSNAYLDVQAMRSLSLQSPLAGRPGQSVDAQGGPAPHQDRVRAEGLLRRSLVPRGGPRRTTARRVRSDEGVRDREDFRIARNLRIPGGTDEIQRVNIAKALGL